MSVIKVDYGEIGGGEFICEDITINSASETKTYNTLNLSYSLSYNYGIIQEGYIKDGVKTVSLDNGGSGKISVAITDKIVFTLTNSGSCKFLVRYLG